MFKYAIKARPTHYQGVQFRSRLEARWACFFDLVGWQWEYEPIDLVAWVPDFRVEFFCHHSECSGSHSLLVEVKPYVNLKQFAGHTCMIYPYGSSRSCRIPADASAAFGINPTVTFWEMAHGAGGGEYDVPSWVPDSQQAWRQAGNVTRWRPNSVDTN